MWILFCMMLLLLILTVHFCLKYSGIFIEVKPFNGGNFLQMVLFLYLGNMLNPFLAESSMRRLTPLLYNAWTLNMKSLSAASEFYTEKNEIWDVYVWALEVPVGGRGYLRTESGGFPLRSVFQPTGCWWRSSFTGLWQNRFTLMVYLSQAWWRPLWVEMKGTEQNV